MGFVRNRDVRQQEAHVKDLNRKVSQARLDLEMIDADDEPEEKADAEATLEKAKVDLSWARQSLKDMKADVKKFNSLFSR